MIDILVFEYNGVLVVDSRLVAQRLGIQHKNFTATINNYKTQMEQAFGAVLFQTEPRSDANTGGDQPKYALLTEDQATFLMTLSRNTPEVVQCKLELVLAFSKAKEILRQIQVETPPSTLLHTNVYIQRLENMGDHIVDYELWTTFREGAEILLLVEKKLLVPVDQMDLCDGSIGNHWSQYREGQEWSEASGLYFHSFRDKRGTRQCRAYSINELPKFRRWLKEIYIPLHLPKYLTDKYGKRAVRQIYREINGLTNYILEITEEKKSSLKQEQLYQKFLDSRAALVLRQRGE